MVPTAGLEPARCHPARDFKSRMSTYSIMWARCVRALL